LYAWTARLYGKNESSIHEMMKNKEKIHASFSVAPQTAKVTAIACNKVLMKVEKALNFWMEKCNFYCLCSALMENMIFIILSSLETVHDTVQYRYCIFSLLLRIKLKRQNPLVSYL
jgi:hypothetical protein